MSPVSSSSSPPRLTLWLSHTISLFTGGGRYCIAPTLRCSFLARYGVGRTRVRSSAERASELSFPTSLLACSSRKSLYIARRSPLLPPPSPPCRFSFMGRAIGRNVADLRSSLPV
eukprot:402862-Prymnesium_polylepis.1